MRPHPPLTPEEHRTIRDWSFAMAIIYSLFLLAFFASVVAHNGLAHSAADTAAAGMRQAATGTTPSAARTTNADRGEHAAVK
jgi:hypothetical protein